MSDKKLTDLEEKFCLVYACGPAPYNGNAKLTYRLVYKGASDKLFNPEKDNRVNEDVDDALESRALLLRDDIRDRIDQIQSESIVSATTLRPRLTETLLKVMDECSTLNVADKFGTPLSPAALRSVAVNAASKLIDIYGIKEDIAHKVMVEGADGDGITFNLIVPEKNIENNVNGIIE